LSVPAHPAVMSAGPGMNMSVVSPFPFHG